MRVLFSRGIVALSKPRCGSTSLRRMLDPLIQPGDIAVNMAGEMPPFHPHLTAPYLRQVLQGMGHDLGKTAWMITVRHPIEMLWSYYKYFKPDQNSRYTFSPKYDPAAPIDFEPWVIRGSLYPNRDWMALGPDWVRPDDLSPLSLEFHIENRAGQDEVDEIFRIEEPARMTAWLEARTGVPIALKHVNQSHDASRPALGTEALDKIRAMMPRESALYGI